MWIWAYVYVLAFSFILSLLAVKGAMGVARRFSLLDEPGLRKIQGVPMPLLGGLGMVLALFGTVLLNLWLLKILLRFPDLASYIPPEILRHAPGVFRISGRLLGIAAGALVVFGVGLADDLRELGAWPKLWAQILAAGILFFSGVRITFFAESVLVSFVLTVLWVVAITNAFNLLDNMDGLSAGIALIAGTFLWGIAVSAKEYFVSLALAAFIGSVAGFLVFNLHPARIFMGDAGSYFIGFLMASVTILGTYYHPGSDTLFTILTPVLILGVPLYDLSSVVLIRICQGRPIFEGDRKHFSHRLMDLGMSQRGAVLFLYLVSFAFGTSSILLGMVRREGLYFVFLQALAFAAIIALLEFFGRRRGGANDR